MAKQLNVSLGFTADTSQAKRQLQDLQNQLSKLIQSTNTNTANFTLSKNIQEATLQATQLKVQLESAVNVNTGRLDLGKFAQSLKNSNMSIEKYKQSLHELGPAGDQAFATLAKSIMQAEIPMRRSNALISEMWVSLKNTARWQISSSILHGFMGAVQEAYGYAQDLNQSLTDIRIVTGKNTDEMAKFAEKANQAAKNLSTTTTEYTKASLIYFQQGLDGSEVDERSAVTIKMANAAGQSAEIISDQMTAVWNNFYDGSKSLEYYADVMTALGAATASSTDEIAGGLEKFAAIGNTIGLSYEYAASALATITSNTRQSEGVVGTALKTIFARIQGLKLGESLEDGTDLNKYSEALQKVGISIFEQNGELKAMDNILDEMAMKWDTLSNAQQTALAQTVAGVRQYTQLVALMENWDNGDNDSMTANLDTAYSSEGTLNMQADIYAQSWEAAQKRVTAAAESIYSALLNDEFFIDLNNSLAGFLEGLGKIFDGMGGLKGILLMIGSVALTVFRDQIGQSIQNVIYSIKMLTSKGREQVEGLRDSANKALIGGTGKGSSRQEQASADAYSNLGSLQGAYLKNVSKMSEEQKKIAQYLMEQQQTLIKNVELANQEVDAAEEQLNLLQRKALNTSYTQTDDDGQQVKSSVTLSSSQQDSLKGHISHYAQLQTAAGQYKQALEQIGKIKLGTKNFDSQKKNLKEWANQVKASGVDIEKIFGKKAASAFNKFDNLLDDATVDVKTLDKAMDKLYSSIDAVDVGTKDLEKIEKIFTQAGMPIEEVRKRMEALANGADNLGAKYQNLNQKSAILSSYTNEIKTKFNELHATTSLGDKFMSVASSIGNVVSIINVFKSTIESLNSSDLTFGEKLMAIMSGLSMILPSVIALLNAENLAMIQSAAVWMKNTAVKAANALSSKAIAVVTGILAVTKGTETASVIANTAAWMSNPIGWIALIIMGVIAAVIGLVAAFTKLNEVLFTGEKIETEHCDLLIENAKKTKELADANKELSSGMDELINKYDQMNNSGANTSEVLSDIQSKMPELIKSYRELSDQANLGLDGKIDELERLGNLANLTGDYSDFTEKKEALDTTIAKETTAIAKSGAQAASTKLAAGLQDTQGKVKGSSYTLTVGGADSGGKTSGEETKAIEILEDVMGDYANSKNDSWGKEGIKLTVEDYTNPLELVDYYEKMVQARDEMARTMTDEEKNESDTFREINEIIQNTAEAYAEAKEQANAYLDSARDSIMIEAGDGSNLETMEEYLAYRKKFLEIATVQYGLTKDQAEEYLKEATALSKVSSEYELGAAVAEKFLGVNMDEADAQDLQDYMKYIEQTFGDLSEIELQTAVQLVADTNSIEEFGEQFQLKMLEASEKGYRASAGIAKQAMQESIESGSINLSSLIDDKNFLTYLEELGVSQTALTQKSYEEQYAIIADFYQKVNGLAYDSSVAQQEVMYQKAADVQNYISTYVNAEKEILAAKQQYADKQKEIEAEIDDEKKAALQAELDAMAQSFQNTYHFEITTNIEDLKNEFDSLMEKIDEIQDRKIELAMDWSEYDELKAGLTQISNFSKSIQNDAKKVGNSYEMTLETAEQWLKFYPELGKIASHTTEGLIRLDRAKTDEIIANKDEELDKSINNTITELKGEQEQLEAELKLKEIDLKAAKQLQEGKLDLENVSASYLVDLRKNLTDYFIENELDEANAQAAALQVMGMNEKQYSDKVAEACKTNAENIEVSAEVGANAQADALTQVVQRWGNFASYLINNIGPILKKIGAAILDPTQTVSGVMKDVWDKSAITVTTGVNGGEAYKTVDGSFSFDGSVEADRQAVMKEVAQSQIDAINADMTDLTNGINSISGQIAALEALKNQDLADLGETDVDKVKGNGSDKDKDVEELEEILERYHEINREVETLEHELSMLEKQKDRTFGANKIKAMEKEIKAMEKLALKQEELYKAQLVYLALDKQQVLDTFSNATFDEDGNISNYSQLQQSAADELNKAKTQYNSSAQTDADKKALEAAEKKYEDQIAILERYEETLDATRESEETMQEAFFNWQDANADLLNYKLEIDIEINDDELRKLDYYLGKTEDDFFQRAEAAGLMNQKLGVYTDNLDRYNQQYEELNQAYKNGEISQEAYIEGLNEINDGIYDNLENIQELDKEMMHYYGDTLAAAGEEIDKITTRMEHQTAVLEHYQSIVELAGKSTDYKKMGTVLEGKAEATKNEMVAAQEEYELYRQQADEKYALWKSAKTEEEAEMYRQQYEDALAAADEAQEEYLSKAEAYAESLKEILENSLNEYAQSLENALTGGTSFDQMNAQLERAASLQEEYLTTTNKIYETNKLMNQAQQEIDKTSNSVAKRKLKSFIDETNQLQQQGKLSQYELEIQQAKYDLLLAEIALEEAQQSKSTVRLQRDSEGNFGYVYTADQDQIAAAQQELADKQNSLYNIALEGANGYAEKYMSTLNEMYDTLTDLQQQYLSGAFESEEEYHNAVTAAKEYYYAKLEEYSDLHSIAIAADTRVIEDAWSSEFNTMIGSTETWKNEVNRYVDETAEAFRIWDEQMDTLTGEMGLGGDLSNLSSAVEDVKNESDDLLITLGDENNGLIGAINQEIDAVDTATGIYALHRAEILQTAAAYEKLAEDIQAVKVAEAKGEESSSSPDAPEQNTGTSTGDDSSNNSGTGNAPSLSIGSAIQVKSGTRWYETSGGKGASGTAHDGEITLINSSGSHAYHIKAPSGKGMGWIKKTDIVGYDTGGYTGEWGSYGKMAMLHEKELILNSRDTENFLSSIELLDNIVKTIDLQAANSQLGGLLKSPSFGNLLQQQQTLEQNVKIEASFPNVQNRTEIEEAFETLVNRASQYANRK